MIFLYFCIKNIVKSYEHPVDNEIIREMIDILRHVAADPKERRSLEAEWLAMKDEEEHEKMLKALEEERKKNAKNAKTIAEKTKTIAEKTKTIATRDKTIEDLEAKVKALEQQVKNTQKAATANLSFQKPDNQ